MKDVIELAKQAGMADAMINAPMSFALLERFAKLVRNAALEQVKQIDWTEIMREGALVTWGDAETLGDRVIEKLEFLKEPTP